MEIKSHNLAQKCNQYIDSLTMTEDQPIKLEIITKMENRRYEEKISIKDD